jgi:hypothetical protein
MESEAKADGERFRVTVDVRSVSLRRTDDAEDDDFKTWALTDIVTVGNAPWTSLWYGHDSDPASAHLHKTSVTNGLVAEYNYSRRSKEEDLRAGIVRMQGARLEVRRALRGL